MTRDEILALEPGRELDALVAEKVFGLQIRWKQDDWTDTYPVDEHETHVDHFSQDILAAWEVVEKMKRDGWSVSITTWGNDKHERPEWKDKWKVVFGFEEGPYAFSSDSIAEAVSKAALVAVLDI